MKRHFILSIVALLTCIASYASIYGTNGTCIGGIAHLYPSLPYSGIWSSSTPAVATVDASGNVYGVSAGTTYIYFYSSFMSDSVIFTVSTPPGPITASSLSICAGDTATFADAVPGGTWMSSSPWIASMVGNVATGVSTGTSSIYYTTGPGCGISVLLTVGNAIPDSIYGDYTTCIGSSVSLNSTTLGGSWSSANPSIATVTTLTGVVTGVAAGTTTLTYSVSGTCGVVYRVITFYVPSGTSVGPISGPGTVLQGNYINLTDSVSGGTWSCSPSTVATIDPTTGVLTGLNAGTVVVTYTVIGCSGPATAIYTVIVTPFDGISGNINFGTSYPLGRVKVWLITYVPPMLTAVDSVILSGPGMSLAYQFAGIVSDSYRVKAALDTVLVGTGFVPTYHNSSFYWYSANVIAHTAGTADLNKNINMMTGILTSGPGFIAGDVTTGANKGTTGGVPVEGLLMYIVNSATNQLIQGTRTDAAGHYSFSNLPVGATYYIFPDSLNYLTTPFTSIALTAGAPSMTAAGFIQHTISKTITPTTVSVGNTSSSATSVLAFPNPTNGRVNIVWQLPAAQVAAVAVCDAAGRAVFTRNIDMTQGAGSTQIDLSALTNGLYIITVKSAALNYNSKIQVQH